MLTASGATFGFRRTLPHILGVVFGFSSSCCWCARASRPVLFSRWPALQTALSWVGAALPAVILGVRMLRHCAASAQGKSRPVRFHEAALLQFLNPKAWVIVDHLRDVVPAAGTGRVPAQRLQASVMEGSV